MESSSPALDAKYQKLASEYGKLRAQASVLKKAVVEEQSKSASLRDQLRQKETALRRAEQEVDSLGFRNKQLEHRVVVLQDEVAKREGRKRDKETKRNNKADTPQVVATGNGSNSAQDVLIFEELQKKIMENAQLASLIDDKERDLQLHSERISSLERSLEKNATEHSELEKRLRRELDTLYSRNSELETKLVEAGSMLGSEDALSASGSDNTPLQNTHYNHHAACSSQTSAHTSEERIALLEKEVAHWRTQFEIIKLNETFANNNKETVKPTTTGSVSGPTLDVYCTCSTAAKGIFVKPSYPESKSSQRSRDSLKEPIAPPTREQLIYNNFSKKFEELLNAKCTAESRLTSFETETEHLQNCLQNATHELKAKDEQMQSVNRALQMLEEDLATTRINYEEQISVLTEQVINLSDQLAACK